jgi:hypothetical protein
VPYGRFITARRHQEKEITMKSFVRVSQGIRFAAVLGGLLALAPSARAEQVTKLVDRPNVEVWMINEPTIDRRVSEYPYIHFRPGDIVWITAGGCDQTGGHGKTWKRYVDPQGPDSYRLYYGLIGIPGATPGADVGLLIPISKVATTVLDSREWRGVVTIPRNVVNSYNLFLRLGFEDDNYEDNGYWGRDGDDGTGDQCKGLPNAYVKVEIFHN